MQPQLRLAASVLLIVLGLLTPVQAWFAWSRDERAMRNCRPLSAPSLMVPLTVGTAVTGVLNGTAVSLPSPAYPETARRMGIAGLVIVQVVLDETGKVISAQATEGPQPLRDVAVQAARKARFSPTKLSGQPVKVTGVINYKFALSQ